MYPQLSIVIPLYNESEIFPLLIKRLDAVIQNSNLTIEVVLVNDGSKDSTPILIQQLALTNKNYLAVLLSRNYGHQTALTAGLSIARGTEAVLITDGDLQDPPELLGDFYSKFKEGYDVVYAVRKKERKAF